jgi:hypothetical protein
MKINKKIIHSSTKIFFFFYIKAMILLLILIPTVRFIDPNILLKQLSFKYNIEKINRSRIYLQPL